MTDRIDLDELATTDEDDEPDASRGDWFWEGDGDPDAEPDAPEYRPAESGVSRLADADESTGAGSPTDADGPPTDAGDGPVDAGDGDPAADADGEASSDDADDEPAIPRVPRPDDDSPVGVPSGSGGAGAGAGPAGAGGISVGDAGGKPGEATPGTPDADDTQGHTVGDGPSNEVRRAAAEGDVEPKASGPHGGGVDDMTMAITYDAARRLSDPQLTIAAAREWADWVGIVGEVEAPIINRFQREHRIDADFFNGTGTGPAERLANIGETSMFYAERTVVVGTPSDEWIAEEAGWEFVPFEEAAEAAEWDIEDGE